MSEPCAFCGGPCNPHDVGTYREVTSWVGGPKKDHARLRTYTGRCAHESCVKKAQAGQAANQPDLFGEETISSGNDGPADTASDLRDLDQLLGEGDNGS